VLVLPEAEAVDVQVNDSDLRIDVFRSSGPGGQSVNTTDSAVRITHLPSGIVVSCQNEKSQLQNKEQALRILRARLLAAAQEAADSQASDARRSQVRTVDRSERIRTYNFAENRISDHRVGFKAYNLDVVLDGRWTTSSAPTWPPSCGAAQRGRGRPRGMSTRALLAAAVDRLAVAGVASPESDAEWLLAHVTGAGRAGLRLVSVTSAAAGGVRAAGAAPGGP
jgi:hypothetical protein